MRTVLALVLSLSAGVAAAQTTPASVAPRAYDPAPWWMDKPIIASTGHVTTEVPANRATFSATYDAVDRDLVQATRLAIQKAKAVTGALTAFGPQNVRVESSVNVRPLYEQYRDKEGNRIDNARADKIDSYQVTVTMQVEVRDVRLVEPAYAILVSAKPSATQPARFRLEPDDATLSQMFKLAVEDARRRAESATVAAGAKLGSVRLIDPTGRACQTDVLVAGAPRGYGSVEPSRIPPLPVPPVEHRIEEIVVTAQKRAEADGLKPEAVQMPIQTPLERLQSQACVVFSLG